MNKHAIVALVAAVTVLSTGTAMAQANVGVSIGINQPGVYGRINIGNFPQPVLVSPQPMIYAPPPVVYAPPRVVYGQPQVIYAPAPVAAVRQPIYLYAPPAHYQNWGRYCGHYNACGQPVYFVHENWVRERYAHEHPGWRGQGQGWDRGRHGPEQGHGNGHGQGHGRGHGSGYGNGNEHGREIRY
jgi:hypothetical protein